MPDTGSAARGQSISSLLRELYAGSMADAATRAELVSLPALEKRIETLPAAIEVAPLIRANPYVSVIAEIKRASPSRGLMAEIADPAQLAKSYQASGASAISVLTEQRQFLGSIEDLAEVRAQIELPVLRKDFVATEYQVIEGRAHGADMILLIVAGLEKSSLSRLASLTTDLGMTAFFEAHNSLEVELAGELGAKIIGINARDLNTFETNLDLFGELSDLVPKEALRIAESAVRTVSDIENYAAAGADAVLVGEALVTGDAEQLLRSFSRVSKV